jgi:ABC-type uncharacterized transport system fused permease/ATPase subunit
MGGIVAYLIFAVPVFLGAFNSYTPTEISKFISNYQFTCQYLIYLFTQLYNTLNSASSVLGNSKRIGELIFNLNSRHQRIPSPPQSPATAESTASTPENTTDNTCLLHLQSLTIRTPDQRTLLVKNLDFEMQRGEHVLVTGRSGCGKTSLFRCINGLWSSYEGQITINPALKRVFFLPQSSYFTNGSLLEQVIYPADECDASFNSAQQIPAWLKTFGLEHLLEKVNFDLTVTPDFNWSTILSAGH